jgi:hypothetical protein
MTIEAIAETRQHPRKPRTPPSVRRMGAVHLIDGLLDPLELLHLAGQVLDQPRVQLLIARLSVELGRPAPQYVMAAPDSRKLHRALLDWQAVLQREDSGHYSNQEEENDV